MHRDPTVLRQPGFIRESRVKYIRGLAELAAVITSRFRSSRKVARAAAIIPNDPGNRFSIYLSRSRNRCMYVCATRPWRMRRGILFREAVRAEKNTPCQVYAVKKHGEAQSVWELYEANRC